MSRRSTFLLPLVLTCLVACVIEAKDEDKKGGGDGSGSDTGSGGDGTLDSDGDGWTNGEELLDPDCEWSTGDPMPGDVVDVTKPGDASDFPPEFEPEPDVVAEGDATSVTDVTDGQGF